MFTGIVEEIGRVRNVVSSSTFGELQIEAETVIEDAKVGDSIAVNGICLTVTKLMPWGFTADVMPETIRSTPLSDVGRGGKVNLERALSPSGRMGGHIVTGHIDGVGRIREKRREKNAVWLEIEAEPEILTLIVHKGSIAIDGVSLTVAEVGDDSFKVSIIPHTGEETILLEKDSASRVNLETDIIGKYVKRFLDGMNQGNSDEDKKASGISWEMLAKHGF